jgi:hypothetical protein
MQWQRVAMMLAVVVGGLRSAEMPTKMTHLIVQMNGTDIRWFLCGKAKGVLASFKSILQSRRGARP